jgi:hypothetical protein
MNPNHLTELTRDCDTIRELIADYAFGLTDPEEVTTYLTNPLLADTDGDFFSDLDEVIAGSNPTIAASIPPSTVGVFTGGDAGEGLDLDGTFLYAFNFGPNGAIGKARDADFVADSSAGITYLAPNQINGWSPPTYGDTANDDVLEGVMQSIRWNGAPGTVQVNLDGLEVGQQYRLQLLFNETGPARGFDVMLEGGVIVNDLIPGVVQEASTTQGVVVTYDFRARDSQLNIMLNGNTALDPGITDRNPILGGVTLEVIGTTVPASLQLTSISATQATFLARGAVGKTYSLDYSPSLATASWSEVSDTVVIGAEGSATVTDSVPAHFTSAQGFWRLRDPAQKPNP